MQVPMGVSGARAGQEFHQGLGALAFFRRCTDPGRVGCVVLYLFWQRADQRHALDRHDLADLVDAELGLSTDDQLGDVTSILEFGFRLEQ